jgi:hypothetical protein
MHDLITNRTFISRSLAVTAKKVRLFDYGGSNIRKPKRLIRLDFIFCISSWRLRSTQIIRNKFRFFSQIQDYRHLLYYTKVLDIIVNKAVLFIYAVNLLCTYRVAYWDMEKNLLFFLLPNWHIVKIVKQHTAVLTGYNAHVSRYVLLSWFVVNKSGECFYVSLMFVLSSFLDGCCPANGRC